MAPFVTLLIIIIFQLTSCGVYQRGEEHEGVFGFLVDDIKQEIRRSARLVRHLLSFLEAAAVGLCTQMWGNSLPDVLLVQDEGGMCWLLHQELQEDGPLPL